MAKAALVRYPDRHTRALRKAIGQGLSVDPERVVCGNGSMELIDLVILGAKRLVCLAPSFGGYAEAACRHGVFVSRFEAPDFQVSPGLVPDLKVGDVLVLGHPNNPTGKALAPEVVDGLLERCESAGATLLLDEAFWELATPAWKEIPAMIRHAGSDALVVVRAATKVYALPGLRLGYAITTPSRAQSMREQMLPWSVNAVADATAASLFQPSYLERSREMIRIERERLTRALSSMPGVAEVVSSDVNFLLFRLKVSAESVFCRLKREGILVRTCSSFDGLKGEWLRIAVRTARENGALIRALEEILRKEDI